MSSEGIKYRRHPNGGGLISEKLSTGENVYIAGVKITGEGKILSNSFFLSVPANSDPLTEPPPRINIQNALVDGWLKIEPL